MRRMSDPTPSPPTIPSAPPHRIDERVNDAPSYYSERNDMLAADMPIYIGKQANAFSASLEMAKTCLLANAGGLAAVPTAVTALKLDLSLTTILESFGVSALFLGGFGTALVSLFVLRNWADHDARRHLDNMNKRAAGILFAHSTDPEERGRLKERLAGYGTEAGQQSNPVERTGRRMKWWQVASCICLFLGIIVGAVLAAVAKAHLGL